MYYTYVLRCKLKNTYYLYIGFTPNLKDRLNKHNSHKVTATKKYETYELIYYEACKSKYDALFREKSLKTGYGRAFIKNRLKSDLDSRV